MAVFVLDKKKRPLMPCSEKRARLLLERGRAVVVRLHPFTIRLKDRIGGDTQALQNPEISGIDALHDWQRPILLINATGRGRYQRTRLNRFGFPRAYLLRDKRIKGFQTGDRVRAQVPGGKHAGTHIGRVAVRASGYFNIQSTQGVVQGISHRHCRVLQRADGYGYDIHPTLTEEARRDA